MLFGFSGSEFRVQRLWVIDIFEIMSDEILYETILTANRRISKGGIALDLRSQFGEADPLILLKIDRIHF